MRVSRRAVGDQTFFVVHDLDLALREAAARLYFTPLDDGMARAFPSSTPHLERVYATFQERAWDLLTQQAGRAPVPWDDALALFLHRVDKQGIDWWLVGSAALAIRGLPVVPKDIDLVVSGHHAPRLGALLADDMIEPVVPVHGWICEWFGRAFPTALIEWVGGVGDDVDRPHPTDFGPAAAQRRDAILWQGHWVHVPPLDLQLAVNEARGRHERAAVIREALRTT